MIELIGDIDQEFDQAFEEIKQATRNAMHRCGEEYVETARESGSYKNRTGNLRNSNSYQVLEDGKVIDEAIGHPQTAEMFKNQEMEGDVTLVAGTGMDYASHVQRKGYDVTDSGQLAAENEARRLLKSQTE